MGPMPLRVSVSSPVQRLLTRTLALAFAGLAFRGAHAQPTVEPRLLRMPAIHGDTIVFGYAGDLWVTEVGSGSVARRLTSHPGAEIRPKISPDGRWVAFSGSYDGPSEIYIVPIEGGEPRRLTYEGSNSNALGWTPDGKIAYGSSAGNFTRRQQRLWYVRPEGGLPIRTPIYEATEVSFLGDGKTLVYTRGFPANWRRYRGGHQGRISLYNFDTNSYRELPAQREQNYSPMAVGRSVYYVSDKNLATLNLYRYDLDRRRAEQLTHYTDADVRSPDTDGKSIVWERDGRLEVFDIASGKVTRPAPRILSDLLPTRSRLQPLADYMTGIAISPSGSRVAIEARGEVFSVPVKSGDVRNLTRTSGARERFPQWSPDGATIAYISDATGNYEIYTQPGQGGAPRRLTQADGTKTFTNLRWSPDGKTLEVRTSTNDLHLLDVGSGQLKHVMKLANRFMPTDWSPDSRWLALINLGENGMGALHLYEVGTGRLTKATEGYYSDNAAAFDRNGKFLYLRSSRNFSPGFGRFEYSFRMDNTERLYVIPLTADVPNPLRPPADEPATAAPDDARSPVRIDFQGLEKRLIPLPVPAGTYHSLIGAKDGLIYTSTTSGTPTIGVHKFNLGTRESASVYTGPNGELAFNPDRTKLAVLAGTNVRVMDVKPGASESAARVDTAEVQAVIDPREEWRQIFWDAWRFERDTFYDANMLGLDWPAIGRRYAAYLPYVAHRSDLNYVIGLMINELGTSHAYVDGGDMGPTLPSTFIGYLGVDYDSVGEHIRLAKIYYGESFDDARRGPLGEPGYRVAEGEYLLEIDGQKVTSKVHPHALLIGKADRYVTLTLNATPTMEGARRVRVRTIASEATLRHVEWIASVRRHVEKLSGGRIGYVHVPSVLHDGAADFIRGFYSQTDKDALILDERWNVGGYFIQQLIVEMLNRVPLLGVQQRNSPDGFSIRAIVGPKVMLINEYAGSGGDSFPWTFRAAGAGKLIGRRTMGALVGLNSGLTLIDNGSVTAPETGIYDLKTGLLAAENVGIEPDIEVDMRPDLVAQGKDPQLDAAIKHLMEELRRLPPKTRRKDLPRVAPPGRVGG